MIANILVANNGIHVLQDGGINLAFTDSIEEARQAAEGFSSDNPEPYWTQHTVSFRSAEERSLFVKELSVFMGDYLSNFLVQDNGHSMVLSGFCIL